MCAVDGGMRGTSAASAIIPDLRTGPITLTSSWKEEERGRGERGEGVGKHSRPPRPSLPPRPLPPPRLSSTLRVCTDTLARSRRVTGYLSHISRSISICLEMFWFCSVFHSNFLSLQEPSASPLSSLSSLSLSPMKLSPAIAISVTALLWPPAAVWNSALKEMREKLFCARLSAKRRSAHADGSHTHSDRDRRVECDAR